MSTDIKKEDVENNNNIDSKTFDQLLQKIESLSNEVDTLKGSLSETEKKYQSVVEFNQSLLTAANQKKEETTPVEDEMQTAKDIVSKYFSY